MSRLTWEFNPVCDLDLSTVAMDTIAFKRAVKVDIEGPGIYQIVNIYNGKRYIGSAINLWSRISGHIRLLCSGEHSNRHLARSYLRHGPYALRFMVLEYADKDIDRNSLYDMEQGFLDRLNPEFNIRRTVYKPPLVDTKTRVRWAKNLGKRFTLVDPNGRTHEIIGIRTFCRDHGLNRFGVVKVLKGRNSHYRGWKLPPGHDGPVFKDGRIKQWIVTSPDGRDEVVYNLNRFCHAHGLQQGNMWAPIGESSFCKGWRCRRAEQLT